MAYNNKSYQNSYSEQEVQSKYNEAVNQLQRLDQIWRSSRKYKNRGAYAKWNLELDAAWLELASDGKLTNEDDEKEYKKMNKLLVRNSKDRLKLYQILLKKELFLRRLQNKQGKGSKYDDFSDYDYE